MEDSMDSKAVYRQARLGQLADAARRHASVSAVPSLRLREALVEVDRAMDGALLRWASQQYMQEVERVLHEHRTRCRLDDDRTDA